MTELGPVLSRLGLAQYLQSLVDEGFDTWETVLEITESDLDILNVKLGHRRRLQREISDTRRLRAEEAAAWPSRTTPYEDTNDERSSAVRFEHTQSSSGKRKYRRHPKPDENAPERPPSAYVIFSNKIREDLKPRHLSFTEIAKRVGENWQALSTDGKEPYETQAAAAKERYNVVLAEYKKTDSYREHCEYLGDFKAKHSTLPPEGKRPRLRNEQSTISSVSNAHDISGSSVGAVAHGRRRVNSVSSSGKYSIASGHPSPASAPLAVMNDVPIATVENSSPAPSSPTPSALYREAMSHTPLQAAQVYANFEDARDSKYGVLSNGQVLPRIFPADGHDPRMITEPASLGGRKDRPQANARRSHHIPASLIHQDTRRSSLTSRSSLSSQLSSGSTGSSYGVYTPMTPVEESRTQRSLPALPKISMNSAFGEKTVDHIQQQKPYPTSLPSSYGSVPPLQSQYHSLSGSSDIPQERHSLMNLSLIGNASIRPEGTQNLRSLSLDLTDAPELVYHPRQLASSHSSYSPQHGQASPPKSRRTLRRDDSPDDTYQDSPTSTDPLSVLAYAGGIIDRDSRRSPRSPSASQ